MRSVQLHDDALAQPQDQSTVTVLADNFGELTIQEGADAISSHVDAAGAEARGSTSGAKNRRDKKNRRMTTRVSPRPIIKKGE